ncbi:MAG: fused MFS/spermidine synthase [Candidatus Doudnabacteria bacterium]|nr:fused MFS/spermidine synthase [Candidatus Doudnabacteria bacterium]
MALEISAARLFAPHYGTSTLVWSSVIGVVLLALSVGYYIGGKLAEQRTDTQLLLRIILGAGLFTLCIPLLAQPLLQVLTLPGADRASLLNLSGGSLAATILLFGFPTFLLGIVSPYILSVLTRVNGHVGNISGQLLAVSTIGGLLGTFLPNLLLIPLIGTTWTILSIGIVLTLMGIGGLTRTKMPATLLLIVLCTTLGSQAPHTTQAVLATRESTYQHIRIIEPAAGVRYMQFDSGFGFQSVYNTLLNLKDDTDSSLTYYDYAASVLAGIPKPHGRPYNVLCIGLAGGTLPRTLHAWYGADVRMTAVEIDPVATDLAKEYMGLAELPLEIVHADGRTFATHNKEQYDYIYVDAYQNELQIPWQLTTKEFWSVLESRLAPNGIVGMNIAALGQTKSGLVNALARTQHAVFHFVSNATLEERRNASHLLIASNTAFTLPTTASLPPRGAYTMTQLSAKLEPVEVQTNLPVLTDDKAPIEWIMAKDLYSR